MSQEWKRRKPIDYHRKQSCRQRDIITCITNETGGKMSFVGSILLGVWTDRSANFRKLWRIFKAASRKPPRTSWKNKYAYGARLHSVSALFSGLLWSVQAPSKSLHNRKKTESLYSEAKRWNDLPRPCKRHAKRRHIRLQPQKNPTTLQNP